MSRHVPFFPPMSRKNSLWLNLFGLPLFGILLVVGAALGFLDLETRIAYETDARTAPGTVVEIVAGSPVVEFVPEESGFVPVVTTARGTFERGADTEVEVTYLIGEPEEAALENGMWFPPIFWGVIEYEVDGLPRTEWVRLHGHEVRVNQTVDIVWAERDPSHVRLVLPEVNP